MRKSSYQPCALTWVVLVSVLCFSSPAFGQNQKNKTPTTTTVPESAKDYPPGWFPLTILNDEPTWQSIRDADVAEPKMRFYLPPNSKAVDGVFFCFQFHSADPRHAARAWNYALVSVPFPLEYDLGVNDKRSGRYLLGHPSGNMGYLLKYLEIVAQQTKHPELTTVPIVGWLMQNGARLLPDLHARAPQRVLAWSDGWPNQLQNIPETLAKVPFAYAWELAGDVKERTAAQEKAGDTLLNVATPASNLSCRATTYGFKHGVYSKYGFFVAFIDRCIKVQTAKRKSGATEVVAPWVIEEGWVGDFNPMSEFAPIAPYKEAKGMIQPMWLPDEYAACMWRAYHSAKPDLKITSPIAEYHGGDRSDCGLGYTPATPANSSVKIVAQVKGIYAKVEFYDGNILLGSATQAPYEIEGIRFEKGIHSLIAIGIAADGKKVSSHPAFLGVE